MSETLKVYWMRFLNACGVDSFSALDIPGLLIVLIAFCLVIFAFYKAANYSIWSSEPHYDEIKMSIFEEDQANED